MENINSQISIQADLFHTERSNAPRNFNMALLLSGKAVSVIGSALYSYAMSLYVLKTTGSAMGFAATLLFGMLPGAILSPFAGIAADRFNRKVLIVGMDVLSGVAVLSLFAYANIFMLNLFGIYLAAILLSVFSAFFSVSMNASIPNLIEDKRLNRVNSLSKGIDSFSNVTGPILGGMIYGLVNIKLFLLINGISFLFSAVAESFLNFRLLSATRERKVSSSDLSSKNILDDIRKGMLLIKSDQVIFVLFSFIVFINFLIYFGIDIPAPYIINNVIKLNPRQFGIITGACPLGLLISSIILSFLPEFKNRRKVFSIAFIGLAVIIAIGGMPVIFQLFFSDSLSFVFYILDYLFFGLIIVFVTIPLQTLLQRRVSDEYRGRVFGLLDTLSLAAIPLGCLMSGFLVERLPPYLLPAVSGIFLFILILKFRKNEALEKL